MLPWEVGLEMLGYNSPPLDSVCLVKSLKQMSPMQMGRVMHTSLKPGSNDQVEDTGLEGMDSKRVVGTLSSLVIKRQGCRVGSRYRYWRHDLEKFNLYLFAHL